MSESSNDSRVVEALEIAQSYEPSEARMQRALARFEATRGAGTAPVRVLGRSMFPAKAGALAAIMVAIGAGWAVHHGAGMRAAPPSASAHSVSAPTATDAIDSRQSAPTEATSIRVEELPTAQTPTAPAPTVNPSPAKRAATSTTRAGFSFDDELALVESARTSLAEGDTAGCLAQVDRYERRMQGGVFEREVAVIRIEALIARGETTRARSLGEEFLAQTPESPYANRVRSLLARTVQPMKAP